MNGYIEICIDGLKTRVDFNNEDGVTGEELLEYFTSLMLCQTFTLNTIKRSLRSVLGERFEDVQIDD